LMASKAKNIITKGALSWWAGRQDMARPRLDIQELSSLKRHSLILTPTVYFTQIGRCYL